MDWSRGYASSSTCPGTPVAHPAAHAGGRPSGTLRGMHVLLDHAATTPPDPAVLAAFTEAALRCTGNPAAGHAAGRAAREVLEEARERIGAALGRSPHEVLLTSGATEADQLAVVGTYRAAAADGRRHVVCSTVEHPAVRDAVTWLAAHERAEVTWVGPSGVGPLRVDDVLAAVRDDTALVAVTGADGEVGVAQEPDLPAKVEAAGAPCHVDVAQLLATRPGPATGSLAVSGHKLGAPVGVGAAVLPRGLAVRPLVEGPGQERGLRSGTPAAALAHALAVALERAVADRDRHAGRAAALTARLADGLAALDGAAPTVAVAAPHRLATHLHLSVTGVDGEALATALDVAGVAASTGTACATGSATPSPVLAAYGLVGDAPVAALRLSVGRTTTAADVDLAVDRIVDVVTRLRGAGGGFWDAGGRS